MGQRGLVIIGSILLLFLTFLGFLEKPDHCMPDCENRIIFFLIVLGLFYGCFGAVVWSSVKLLVHKIYLNTAEGLSKFIWSFGLIFGPIIAGNILQHSKKEFGYRVFLVYCLLISMFCIVLSIAIEILD